MQMHYQSLTNEGGRQGWFDPATVLREAQAEEDLQQWDGLRQKIRVPFIVPGYVLRFAAGGLCCQGTRGWGSRPGVRVFGKGGKSRLFIAVIGVHHAHQDGETGSVRASANYQMPLGSSG